MSAQKKHSTTRPVFCPRTSVISAHSTPPATIHGVRRPRGIRVRSDSAETKGIANMEATTPTTTSTARGITKSVATGSGRPVDGLMVTDMAEAVS